MPRIFRRAMARSSERTLPVEKPKRKLDLVNSFSPSPHSPQAHAVPRSIHITRNLTRGERALAGSGFTSKAGGVRATEADSSAEPARGRPVPSNRALPPTTSLQNKSSSGRHRLPETRPPGRRPRPQRPAAAHSSPPAPPPRPRPRRPDPSPPRRPWAVRQWGPRAAPPRSPRPTFLPTGA